MTSFKSKLIEADITVHIIDANSKVNNSDTNSKVNLLVPHIVANM